MKNKNIIGILGGMGPSASGYLYGLINSLAVEEYGAKKNNDFPETILYSVPVPDFISSNKNKETALQMLKQRIKVFNTAGVAVMGIACNTGHVFLPELQKVSKAKFVSMIDATAGEIANMQIQTIGLLATTSTVHAGLYQKVLHKEGIEIILANALDQKIIDTVIRKILAEKAGKEEEQKLLSIAKKLLQKKAEGIVLGCTELPLLFPKRFPIPVFNSVEILAKALLKSSYFERGE